MKPLRILLLEPKAVPCGSLAPVLNDAGHVVVAMNDLGVLAHLDTFIQVDLVLVDAGDHSEQLADIGTLMENPRYRHLMVAVVCESILAEASKLHRSGNGQVMVKPIDPAELVRRVNAARVATH